MTAWHGHNRLTRWYRPCCRLCEKRIGVARIYHRAFGKRETRRILEDEAFMDRIRQARAEIESGAPLTPLEDVLRDMGEGQ